MARTDVPRLALPEVVDGGGVFAPGLPARVSLPGHASTSRETNRLLRRTELPTLDKFGAGRMSARIPGDGARGMNLGGRDVGSSTVRFAAHGRPRAQEPGGDVMDTELRWMLNGIGEKIARKFHKPREAFQCMDCDCDGQVSQSEVRHFFRNCGFPHQMADKFYDFLKLDGSDWINYNSFVKTLWPYIDDSSIPESMMGIVQQDSVPLPWCGDALGMKISSYPAPSDQVELDGSALGQDSKSVKEMRDAVQDIKQKMSLKFKHVRCAFRYVDLNKDGTVDPAEMRYFFSNFGYSAHIADQIFAQMDKGGRGGVSYAQFIALFESVLGSKYEAPRQPPIIISWDRELEEFINELARVLDVKFKQKFKTFSKAIRSINHGRCDVVTRNDLDAFFNELNLGGPQTTDKVLQALVKEGELQIERRQLLDLFAPVIGLEPSSSGTFRRRWDDAGGGAAAALGVTCN